MRKMILIASVGLAIAATICLADMRRVSTAITGGTNAGQTVTGTINDRGLLYRLGVTVNGGSLNVNVADFDGTTLIDLTGFTGSTNFTPATPTAFVGASITASNASTSNIVVTVTTTANH